MHHLARLSLANRAVVALLTLIIAVAGTISMGSLKQELIPAISIPQTTVLTTAVGSSPEIIDEQISLPLSKALKGVSGVETVAATSAPSVSTITVSTEYGLDQDKLESSLRDAIETVSSQLPEGSTPEILAGSTSDIPVVMLTASSDASAEDLSQTLETSIVPEIQGIEGVRDVQLSGETTQRITITPDSEKLAAAGLTRQSISSALQNNGTTLPAGTIVEDNESVSVQAGDPVESLQAVKALPLLPSAGSAGDGAAAGAGQQPSTPGGADASTGNGGQQGVQAPQLPAAPAAGPVKTIGDVATVKITTEKQTSITRTNGVPSQSVQVTALPDADVVSISHAVNDKLDGFKAALGKGGAITPIFDQAPFIEQSISHLAIEGLLGLAFAVVVILVFLLSLRSTLVTAISIPISVLVTFIGLNLGGYSLNMLTLGALTIAIGRVVDDSIVVIENIKRHLSYGEEKRHAILTAVKEVSGAITASTLTTIMVFLPIALVGDMVGELFRPFALTVAIAMLSSLLVALTIVPILAYWFMRQPQHEVDPAEVRAASEDKERKGWLQRGYLPILRGTQRHPVWTLVGAALILVLTAGILPLLKVDFLGSTGQNSLQVTQKFASGTDLDTLSSTAQATEDALLDSDGVESVLLTAGVGGEGLAAMLGGGGTSATFIVNTDPDGDQTAISDAISQRLSELPHGDQITVGQAAAYGSSTVDVIVKAHDDKSALSDASKQVLEALKDTPHATDITSDLAADQPTIQVSVDRQKAAEAGLTEMQVSGMVASAANPQAVDSIRIDGKDLSVYVDAGTSISTMKDLQDFTVPSATGPQKLSDLARIERVSVPSSVSRQGGELVATVSLTPDEGELGGVTAAVQDQLDGLDLPAGVSVELGGVSTQQTDSFKQLGLAMLVAIAIVYLLMVAEFRSLVQPLILLVSIPFAATGAILLMLASGKPMGVASLIGLLMLIGIVVTNAIVLIDLVNQYRRQGQSVQEAVVNGARQRLRPILMTALATIFALTPMALGVTGSSGFISQDLAIVVIGGLVSSTALTLILVPVLYRLVEGRQEKREQRKAARAGGHGAHAAPVEADLPPHTATNA
ncbi:efflux RND transporter permease subunit [Arthrobacter sp. JSM 101049]|uniref:efflux RND transporter permease subunit n=1 Tax=Arthrobacter sp. JSM 101049 TaxID=929097 RepID=UPI0035699220